MTDLSQINLTPKSLEEALETIGHLAKIIIELKEENKQLKEENARLKEQLNGWAWIMSTQDATYFKLERSRGRKVAKELIGDFRDHIYVTDRYSAYDFLPDKYRQVCWAHLKRDFQKISERSGVPGTIGKKLLKAYERLFQLNVSSRLLLLLSNKNMMS